MEVIDGGGSVICTQTLDDTAPKRVPVVLTDEYRTTKACPACKKYELRMKCPKGNATYYNRYFNREFRKQIHGLSHCGCCKRLFSRDYIASLNICRSFVSYFKEGKPLFCLKH